MSGAKSALDCRALTAAELHVMRENDETNCEDIHDATTMKIHEIATL